MYKPFLHILVSVWLFKLKLIFSRYCNHTYTSHYALFHSLILQTASSKNIYVTESMENIQVMLKDNSSADEGAWFNSQEPTGRRTENTDSTAVSSDHMHVTVDANPYTHYITSPFTHTIIISKAFFLKEEEMKIVKFQNKSWSLSMAWACSPSHLEGK